MQELLNEWLEGDLVRHCSINLVLLSIAVLFLTSCDESTRLDDVPPTNLQPADNLPEMSGGFPVNESHEFTAEELAELEEICREMESIALELDNARQTLDPDKREWPVFVNSFFDKEEALSKRIEKFPRSLSPSNEVLFGLPRLKTLGICFMNLNWNLYDSERTEFDKYMTETKTAIEKARNNLQQE